MQHVKLSQVEQYSVIRTRDNMAVITMLDNITEIPPQGEETQSSYEADMYRIMLPWREGIDDPSNHASYLARAKELEVPQTDGDKRIARDIVL